MEKETTIVPILKKMIRFYCIISSIWICVDPFQTWSDLKESNYLSLDSIDLLSVDPIGSDNLFLYDKPNLIGLENIHLLDLIGSDYFQLYWVRCDWI